LSEEESLDEAHNKILFNYIKSLGYDPKFMPFAKLSTYSRSDAFKRFKQGHVFDKSKQDIKNEEIEAIDDLKSKHQHHIELSRKYLKRGNKEKAQHHHTQAYNINTQIMKHPDYNLKFIDDPRTNDALAMKHDTRFNEQGVAEGSKYPWLDSSRKKPKPTEPEKGVAEGQLDELNRDTVISYVGRAEKDQDKQFTTIAKGIRDKDPKSANKAGHKFSMRSIGLNRAEKRLNNESLICAECQVDPCICDDSHGFVNEAGTGHLMSFIKAKGLNPLAMDGNQKKAYSRSSEYRIFKSKHHAEAIKETSGMGERADDWDDGITPAGRTAPLAKKKTVKEEADVKDVVSMDIPLLIRVLEFIREDVKTDMDLHRVVENLIELRTEGVLTMDHYDQAVKIKAIKEEINQLDELSNYTLKSYVNKIADPSRLSRGMTPKGTLKSIKAIGGVTKALRKQYEKPLSELKKTPDNMDSDTIGLAREDLRKWFSKTNPEGDWKRINSKGEAIGPCAREPGEPKPKCMSKKTRSELSKSERAAAVATKRKNDPVSDRAGKGGKPVNVSNYGKGKLSEDEIDEACWDTHKQVGTKMKGGKMVPNCVPKNEEVEQIDEKNSPTNPTLWSRAKSMARSKFDVYPSAYANGWASKWYKSKGGGWKSVKEDTVQEGIYGIEDSPMAATHSVKAMESKKISNAAKMVKAIHKKRVNETTYDWEKSEKGGDADPEIKTTAKVTLKGGKTMTGKPRDTVEIEPVLRTKINSPNGMKPNV
jgi:hypothetical protein